ncbi:MAG: hypothetical protein ACE5MH_03735 [Terriglobia bacterium]
MSESLRLLTYALAGTALFLLGLWFSLWWKSRQQDPVEVERRRRLHINRIGRLAEGRVMELLDARNGVALEGPAQLILYRYQVRGVEYQAAQDITFLGPETPALDLRRVASGQAVNVKYDPKNPTNSIILCEAWSGI